MKCSICFKVLKSKASLKKHISNVHEENKPIPEKKKQLQCRFCPTVLGSKAALQRHISQVHEKNKHTAFAQFNAHLPKVHEGKEPNIHDQIQL